MSNKPTQAFSMRLPTEIGNQLEEFSRLTNRSKTSIASEAIIEYLERYSSLLMKYLEIKEEIKNKKIVSQEEIELWIEALGKTNKTQQENLNCA